MTSRRQSSFSGIGWSSPGAGTAKTTNVAPLSRHARPWSMALGAPVPRMTRSARLPSLASRSSSGSRSPAAIASNASVAPLRARPVEPVLAHVGREDATRAERERKPDVEQPADAAAHHEHRRARSHACAHLRAHDARERLDERAFLVGHRVRHLEDAAVGLQRGHAHVLREPAGIEVGGVQRVARGVVAGQAVAAGVAGHVVRHAPHDRPPRRSSRPRPPRRRRRRPRARARSAPWARDTTRARRSRRCRSP